MMRISTLNKPGGELRRYSRTHRYVDWEEWAALRRGLLLEVLFRYALARLLIEQLAAPD
jgi:hypothetical protein